MPERIAYLTANIPNPFFGLLPTTAAAGLQGTNIARERLLRPYPAVRLGQHVDERRLVLVHARAVHPAAAVLERVHALVELHLLEVHRGHRVPQRRRPRAVEGHLERRLSPPADGQRHPGKCPWAADAASARTSTGWSRRSSAAGSSRGSTPTRVASRSASATSSSPATSMTSTLPASEQTLARWFNTDAGFNKNSAQALGQQRADVPAAAGERAHRQRQQHRSVAHQEHAGGGPKTIELRFDSLNAFNHPYFPGTEHEPDGRGVRNDQRVDAAQLRAAHAGVGEVPVLGQGRHADNGRLETIGHALSF